MYVCTHIYIYIYTHNTHITAHNICAMIELLAIKHTDEAVEQAHKKKETTKQHVYTATIVIQCMKHTHDIVNY